MITGFAASALDALQALIASRAQSKTNSTAKTDAPFKTESGDASALDTSNVTVVTPKKSEPLSPSVMAALLEAQSQSSNASVDPASAKSEAQKSFFGELDSKSGIQISQHQMPDDFVPLGARGASNDAGSATRSDSADDVSNVFGALDTNGDGSVSVNELSAALMGAKKQGEDDIDDADSADSIDALRDLLKNTSSKTVTNGDGSTTTSLTNADGSSVSLTSVSAARASAGATSTAISSYNFIEQLVQSQAKVSTSAAASGVSISA